VLYGCSITPTWIFLFTFGVVLGLFSNSSKTTIESFCDNVDMNSNYINSIRKAVSKVDVEIGQLANKKMCSDVCPCANDETKDFWYDIEEVVLNTYGRTKNEFTT